MDNKIYSIGQKNAQAKKMRGQKTCAGKKTRSIPEFCQRFKKYSSYVLSDRFHRQWAQVSCTIAEKCFFSQTERREFYCRHKKSLFKKLDESMN
jgi:hypothetical protein